MELHWKQVCLLMLFAVPCFALEKLLADEDPPQSRGFLFGHRKPRTFNIFSRPPQEHPEDEKPKEYPLPSGIITHLGNVFHGGSIGIEIRPLGFLEHAKKILPGGHDQVGQPDHQKEPDEEPPKKDWEEIVEEPVWEEEKKPLKPKPERPRWEDIGEEPAHDGSGILQPRTRPKRFVESKIYHVPVLFRSNAQPDKVIIKKNTRSKRKPSAKKVAPSSSSVTH